MPPDLVGCYRYRDWLTALMGKSKAMWQDADDAEDGE